MDFMNIEESKRLGHLLDQYLPKLDSATPSKTERLKKMKKIEPELRNDEIQVEQETVVCKPEAVFYNTRIQNKKKYSKSSQESKEEEGKNVIEITDEEEVKECPGTVENKNLVDDCHEVTLCELPVLVQQNEDLNSKNKRIRKERKKQYQKKCNIEIVDEIKQIRQDIEKLKELNVENRNFLIQNNGFICCIRDNINTLVVGLMTFMQNGNFINNTPPLSNVNIQTEIPTTNSEEIINTRCETAHSQKDISGNNCIENLPMKISLNNDSTFESNENSDQYSLKDSINIKDSNSVNGESQSSLNIHSKIADDQLLVIKDLATLFGFVDVHINRKDLIKRFRDYCITNNLIDKNDPMYIQVFKDKKFHQILGRSVIQRNELIKICCESKLIQIINKSQSCEPKSQDTKQAESLPEHQLPKYLSKNKKIVSKKHPLFKDLKGYEFDQIMKKVGNNENEDCNDNMKITNFPQVKLYTQPNIEENSTDDEGELALVVNKFFQKDE